MAHDRRFGTNRRPPAGSSPLSAPKAPAQASLPELPLEAAIRRTKAKPQSPLPAADPIEMAVAAAGAMPALLKPKDVADLLAVSERTLERWRITGEGPRFVRLGSKVVRYTREEVGAFVAARVKANTGQ